MIKRTVDEERLASCQQLEQLSTNDAIEKNDKQNSDASKFCSISNPFKTKFFLHSIGLGKSNCWKFVFANYPRIISCSEKRINEEREEEKKYMYAKRLSASVRGCRGLPKTRRHLPRGFSKTTLFNCF